MKKITLTQEDPVIFMSDVADAAYQKANDYVAEQKNKGIKRGYSVAYAVIITPLKLDSETLVSRKKR